MKIEEQVCSREQMAELKKLGIDDSEASMCWIHYETDGADEWFVTVHDESCYEAACMEATPTFTAEDLIVLIEDLQRLKMIDIDIYDEDFFCYAVDNDITHAFCNGKSLVNCLYGILVNLKNKKQNERNNIQ